MTRLFNQRQRRCLAWVSAGRCRKCGKRLADDFHADHVIPYSRGGLTATNNGQALCPSCNLRKGAQWK